MKKTRLKYNLTFSIIVAALPFFAQTPMIYGYSPSTGTAGDTITITGVNFSSNNSDNDIWFGSNKANIINSTPTSIKIEIPHGTIYKFPAYINKSANLQALFRRPLKPEFPCLTSYGINSASFSSSNFSVGNSPRWLAIGDLDLDGKPDLVSADYFGATLSILKNTSQSSNDFDNSSFTFQNYLSVGTYPRSVELEDINNDGKLDVLTVCQGSNQLSVFINTSTSSAISFQSRIDFNTGAAPYTLSVGDFNVDGRLDIMVVNKDNNNVSIYQNNITSSNFNASSLLTPINLPVGASPINGVVEDFDQDGYFDIGVCNSNSSNITIYRNLGSTVNISSASFACFQNFSMGLIGTSITFADVDKDSKPEMIATSYANSWLSVYPNTSILGNISFGARIDFQSGSHPYRATVGDFDGDSKTDIAVVNSDGNNVSVFRNVHTTGLLSTSSLAPKVDFSVDTKPYFLTSADLDSDNDYEIISANFNSSNITVLKNNLNTCIESISMPENIAKGKVSIVQEGNSIIIKGLVADKNRDVVIMDLFGRIVIAKKMDNNNRISLENCADAMLLIAVLESGEIIYKEKIIFVKE